MQQQPSNRVITCLSSVAAAALALASFATPAIAEPLRPMLAVEQEGQVVPATDGVMKLRRAPFTLVVTLPPGVIAMLDASVEPGHYELARTGQRLDSVFVVGGGFAEDDFNKLRTLYLSGASGPGFHYWDYRPARPHRFDSVVMEGGHVVGRRVTESVTTNRLAHRLETLAVDDLYLVGRLMQGATSLGAIALKLTFVDATPASAPASADATVATVEGRPITKRAVARAYDGFLAPYRRGGGAGADLLTLKALGLERRALQDRIDWELALLEASRRKIDVTLADVRTWMATLPQLQENGRYIGDTRAIELFARSQPGVSREALLEELRQSQVFARLEEQVTRGMPVGPERTRAYEAFIEKVRTSARIAVDRALLAQIVREAR